MLGEKELTEVMDAIYFAAHQKNGWQDCLGRISEISGGETAQLLLLNKESGQPIAGYQSRVPQAACDIGSRGDAEFSLCAVRHEIDGALVELIVQRPADRGEFSPDETSMMTTLMPHIARAMRQEESSRLLHDRQAAVHRQKQGALLLLDGQKNVVFLSVEAERQLSQTTAVGLDEGRLRLSGRRKQAELDALIQQCFERKHTDMISVMEDAQESVRLLVSTVQPRDEKLFQSHGLVAVFLVGDATDESSEEEVIGQWLGLTESESRIASLIAQGRRPADIASDIALSVHTVRHHIKNIYRKTGAHSQSQLTALVLNLPV
ncbi:helix-turn-helix transcriptional regulator [Alcanivorax sp. S6407]|uniref:helix-turn-helix transcriptional regulator n=1 Tax=Alcanivorax sp. S6407 TaxID=2926424 RepID=UPI001FF5D1F0|nr:helix-turn-helix transcriptional regulator [Alcanivorax sp. S6407]